MSRRRNNQNQNNQTGNKANRPSPLPLSSRSNAVDLATEAKLATERQKTAKFKNKRNGQGNSRNNSASNSSSNLPVDVAAAPWAISFMLGEARYNEEAFNSASQDLATHDRWGYYPDRKVRYDVFWGHYEGNVYRAIHRWAAALKIDRQLYAHTRTIFSPAYRIGEFWAGHLWGGPLDPEAGDGVSTPSSLPIIIPDDTDESIADALRKAIATAWEYSIWQSKKDTVTRTGAVKGDVGMLVHDDGSSVSIRVVDPGTIVDLRRDSRGNIKEYVLQEWRTDPEYDDSTPFGRVKCRYNEWCRKVGDQVVYTTYRNGVPYDWREYPDGLSPDLETGPTWYAEYTFVPMVFIQHRDMNKGFGWSELQPDFGKMYELDDIASKLSDQIRKIVDCPWYIGGAEASDVTIQMDDMDDWGGPINGNGHSRGDHGGYSNDSSSGSGRQSTPIWYGPEGSEPHAMVAPLDISAVGQHIKDILDDLESDHPELATDNVGAASSAEARKVAREKVEAMVVQRRANYDDALKRILQMLISIGAINEYEGFEAFDEDSYDDGDLDFTIGARPVFAMDVAEQLAESQVKATTFKTWKDAGACDEIAYMQSGYSDQEVKDLMKITNKAKENAMKMDVKRQAGLMAANGGAGGFDADGNVVDGNPVNGSDSPDKNQSGDNEGHNASDIVGEDPPGVMQ